MDIRLGHDDGNQLKLRTEKPQWGRKECKRIEKVYQRKILYSLGYDDPNSTLSIHENMTMRQDKGHILLKNKPVLFHFPLKSNVDKACINRPM